MLGRTIFGRWLRKKSHEKFIEIAAEAEREYAQRKIISDSADQLLRWIEREHKEFYNNADAIRYLEERKEKSIERAKKLREDAFERQMKNVDRNKMTKLEIEELHDRVVNAPPVLKNDELLVIDDIITMLKENDFGSFPKDGTSISSTPYATTVTTSTVTWLGNLQRFADKKRLDLKEQLDWICRQIQVDIEKIRLLVDQAKEDNDKYWKQAGDILIPLYENLFERGIKHEILNRTKPGTTDDYDEFGSDLNLADIIKTRQEMADEEKKNG